MSKATHTPGPWSIIQFGGMQIGHEPTGEAVCTMWGSDTDATDPKIPNARLIAAAPDLLEALEDMLEACMELIEDRPFRSEDDIEVCRARAAIAKARGE